jgi:16S rRNA (cytosine967-C5)-methyltransferase
MDSGSCARFRLARCSRIPALAPPKSIRTISPARRAAFEILQRVESENAYASILLAALDQSIRADDRALCHELVLGVLRRRLWLDRALEHFANRRIEDLDLAVTLSLRLGLYQLRFLSRIPPSAAVNESVELVRAAKLRSAGSFVNAVLRRATREPDYDPAAAATNAEEKLAIETSHPLWLIKSWIDAFGFEEAAAFAEANNRAAPLTFRLTAKALKQSEEASVIERLKAVGAIVSPSKIVQSSWRVERDGKLPRELSREGLIYFQDEASQLVAHLLKSQSGDRVLDVCAAPGSKTTHLAALAPGASIFAGDLFEHRLRTLNELAAQQDATVHLVAHDATRGLPFPDHSFDRVLVDAPCSGTGTLRRNPEIRWRLTSADVAELAEKQKLILESASAMVRPGGRLIYSTCSVERAENEDVVRSFLDKHKDFDSVALDAAATLRTETGAIRTWTHRDGTDGFFVAAFERSQNRGR